METRKIKEVKKGEDMTWYRSATMGVKLYGKRDERWVHFVQCKRKRSRCGG
jgi:hypothetical protein